MAMNDKQGIYWYQGMFMQPQHFQLADLHAQFRDKPLMETGLPHFWGVGDLELSQSAIANRTIEVTRAQLLFPDRSYVEFPGNAVIAEAMKDVQAAVRVGSPISRPLSKQPMFPNMVVQMMEVGEQTGQTSQMLEKVADFYDDEANTATESLTSALEPLMVVLLGAVIGVMVVCLYLPMFSVYQHIQSN